MQTRKIVNVGAGATAVYTVVALSWSWVYKAIVVFGDGQAAYDMIEIVSGLPINWNAIYFWVFLICAGTLITNNYTSIVKWQQARARQNARAWNWSAIDAINYISKDSHFAESLEYSRAPWVALKAFEEAAIDGKIATAGRRPGTGTLIPIESKGWAIYEIDAKTVSDFTSTPKFSSISLTKSLPDDRSVTYEGIMVDRRQILKTWPPRSRSI